MILYLFPDPIKKKKYLIVLDLRQGLLKVMQHLGDGSNGLLYSQWETMYV